MFRSTVAALYSALARWYKSRVNPIIRYKRPKPSVRRRNIEAKLKKLSRPKRMSYTRVLINIFKTLWLIIGIMALVSSTIPEAPRAPKNNEGTNEYKEAFSLVTHVTKDKRPKESPNNAIVFDIPLIEKNVRYNKENGIISISHPGIYMISFTVTGENAIFSLRKRPSSKTKTWDTLITSGNKGGAYTILINVETGEEMALFANSGALAVATHSFSGFRLSKKL